ncbi:single-stranded DNA-binding protein [Haloechinothrix sp. YIM 98757]|uniref:Single-stranded DNA-binding protein n=1 Tax=Haloechinothrix aidingensis TaxID=2752311 RepID=A0A838AB10_9PSEU|nr:single-stranded DNA-binding protein [Haloechinothrix aidingensis]MBA0126423.1 single-stranded DNA-binding protein [Haloechinothrix aidingensis]
MAVGETILGLNGTIGSELHRRVAEDGTESVGFRLVSTERRFDKERGEWVDGRRCVIWVTCWRRLAANVCASLCKGDAVLVTGRLYTREQDAGDVLQQTAELDAFAVGPNLARATAQLRRRRDSGPGRAQLPAAA